MKRKALATLVAILVSMFASGVWAQPIPTLAIPMTSDVLKKLQTIPNRATQLNALMANPTTKAFIESIAKTKNMSLSQLATTSLDSRLVSGSPILLSPNISCPSVPWTAGVKFTPFIAATVCSGPWGTTNLRMAELYAEYISSPELTHLTVSDWLQRNCLPLRAISDRNARVLVKIILPPIRATYLVTIHAVSLRSSFQLAQHLPNIFVSKYAGANINDTSPFGLNLTALSDNSGFVGIMNANTTPEYQKEHPYLSIYSEIHYGGMLPFLLFGGVTITQL